MLSLRNILLETLHNQVDIKEDGALGSTDYLTVSQSFNPNLRYPLCLAVFWLNSPILCTFLQCEKAYSDGFNGT